MLRVPAALGAAAVACQIAYPLVHGTARDRLSIAIVVLFAAASASHAVVRRGRVGAAAVLVFGAGGFAAEVIGLRADVPFGNYHYADSLGAELFGVPMVVALAWTMIAWPAALIARRLVTSYGAQVLVGAWALAAWDVFLDPQMVADGHWSWSFAGPHLPGVQEVPLTNYAGWLLVALLLSAAVQALLGRATGNDDPHDDRTPYALYLWTYVGSVFAQLVFLDLPGSALWGALAMGVVVVPLLWSLRPSLRR